MKVASGLRPMIGGSADATAGIVARRVTLRGALMGCNPRRICLVCSFMALDSRVEVTCREECLHVSVRGQWSLADPMPAWRKILKRSIGRGDSFREVRVDVAGIGSWDSSLLLFLSQIRDFAEGKGVACSMDALPELLRQLLEQRNADPAAAGESAGGGGGSSFLAAVGERFFQALRGGADWMVFWGECVLGGLRVTRRWRKFRWRDCLVAMQQAGAMALPIVGLISFLVGLILAYQAAVQLRQYGAEIFVANLVGLSVVREMGPMMTAVILAGRTGAAFAAQIGNMKMNEEIDALETLGINPVDFLVLPRMLALILMVPLLTIYADMLGILGGFAVGVGTLDIASSAYWFQTQEAIGLNDLASGLIKSVVFGVVVASCGCFRGLQSDRSSEGVGRATTSAVVTAIFLIVVLDAGFAVLFDRIGI